MDGKRSVNESEARTSFGQSEFFTGELRDTQNSKGHALSENWHKLCAELGNLIYCFVPTGKG